MTIYKATVSSLIQYSILRPKKSKNELQIVQNPAIRIIFKLNRTTPQNLPNNISNLKPLEVRIKKFEKTIIKSSSGLSNGIKNQASYQIFIYSWSNQSIFPGSAKRLNLKKSYIKFNHYSQITANAYGKIFYLHEPNSNFFVSLFQHISITIVTCCKLSTIYFPNFPNVNIHLFKVSSSNKVKNLQHLKNSKLSVIYLIIIKKICLYSGDLITVFYEKLQNHDGSIRLRCCKCISGIFSTGFFSTEIFSYLPNIKIIWHQIISSYVRIGFIPLKNLGHIYILFNRKDV
ncbi:hypothetical protein BpHYR1_038267 [Brachionus plicatilis]|uniref:Uncharacterized protein n=1 Tax=Brachionus plicatilis TaxID=10195 RepID=A0A3M7RGI7_BRAPC|nr:hypothetical protein BpHYR1_038267 [Brachionus plicatilis]